MTTLRQYGFSVVGDSPNPDVYAGLRHPLDIVNLIIPDRKGWEAEICWYQIEGNENDFIYTESLRKNNWCDTTPYTWVSLDTLNYEYITEMDNFCNIMNRDQAHCAILGWTMRFRAPDGSIWFMPALDGISGIHKKETALYPTKLSDGLEWMNIAPPIYVRTDHSIHVYYPTLLPIDRFMQFMGSAMLSPSVAALTDSKWVAASLIRSRGVLRLTKKQYDPSYLPVPMDPWYGDNANHYIPDNPGIWTQTQMLPPTTQP